MSIDPTLATLIAELGGRMGLPRVSHSTPTSAARSASTGARWSTSSTVRWRHACGFADLGVPAAGPAAYEDLLRGNFFWRSTLGAALSLSGDQPPHAIIALPVAWRGLDGPRLATQLESFSQHCGRLGRGDRRSGRRPLDGLQSPSPPGTSR